VDAGHIRVIFDVRDSTCIAKVAGELTLATEAEFTTRATEALAAFRGPVLFDLTGLDIVDCHGARALAGALRAAPPGEAGVQGCSPLVRRFLEVTGFDLPQMSAPAREVPAQPRPPAVVGAASRGDALVALAHATEANARQSATHASEVMSRLAATYAELALNSRYRVPRRSDERGRLLALSGRALDLSRQYQRHGASGGTG
jgi:anti-anti-sigma factor